MRPPLVLEVFEQHPTIGPLAYRSDGAFMPYILLATEKKFTDAELAATYWKARALGWPVLRADTLHRFASLPHIDVTE